MYRYISNIDTHSPNGVGSGLTVHRYYRCAEQKTIYLLITCHGDDPAHLVSPGPKLLNGGKQRRRCDIGRRMDEFQRVGLFASGGRRVRPIIGRRRCLCGSNRSALQGSASVDVLPSAAISCASAEMACGRLEQLFPNHAG